MNVCNKTQLCAATNIYSHNCGDWGQGVLAFGPGPEVKLLPPESLKGKGQAEAVMLAKRLTICGCIERLII